MARKSIDHIQIYLEHGIDVPGRRIELSSFADDDTEEAGIEFRMAERIVQGLYLMGKSTEPVTLIINSHGGEDDHARAIIAAIRNCPAPVHGVVYGRAESAAAWILQACDLRIMDRSSNLMLHLGESAKDRHSAYVDRLFVDDVLSRLRERDPGYARSKLMRHLHEDWYVYATQAVELGLADEVLG